MAEHLAGVMRESGFAEVALIEPLPGRPSVVGRLRGTGGGRSLILNGHIDIYELAEDWTRDPFAPAIEDGRIYGAGVADEKAGTAALLAAAAVLQGVARELARRGDDLGLVDEIESQLDRPLPHGLADRDHVLGRPDLPLILKQDRHGRAPGRRSGYAAAPCLARR